MGLFAIKSRVRGPAVPRPEPRGEPQADRVVTAAANDEPLAALLSTPPPDPQRAGLVQWQEGGLFLHYCECGAWGVFGYDVDLVAGRLGRWYCGAHRPEATP